MPAPRKPRHLKIITGSRRVDEHAEVPLPLVDEVPAPPDWLPNAHAVREWQRLAPILFACGLLTEASLSALGMLCAIHGKLLQSFEAGVTPTGHLLAQYRSLVNDFGMTPAAQSKVTVQSKPVGNRFASNGRRGGRT
jgi:phage terminase small subunit